MKGKKKEDQNVDASVQEGGTKCPRKVYIGRDLGGREKREEERKARHTPFSCVFLLGLNLMMGNVPQL